MKRMIKASELFDYEVSVNFASFVGVDEIYSVRAKNEDDAIADALEQAADDLSIDNVEDLGDGDFEVTVNFASFVGADEVYTITADDADEAEIEALQMAKDDLSAEIVSDEDEDEE